MPDNKEEKPGFLVFSGGPLWLEWILKCWIVTQVNCITIEIWFKETWPKKQHVNELESLPNEPKQGIVSIKLLQLGASESICIICYVKMQSKHKWPSVNEPVIKLTHENWLASTLLLYRDSNIKNNNTERSFSSDSYYSHDLASGYAMHTFSYTCAHRHYCHG